MDADKAFIKMQIHDINTLLEELENLVLQGKLNPLEYDSFDYWLKQRKCELKNFNKNVNIYDITIAYLAEVKK